MLDDDWLEEAYSAKYLGIQLTGGLTWSTHMDGVLQGWPQVFSL